jgi:DNA polymerase I
VFIFNVLSLLCLLLAVSIYISRIRFFVYVIGPRPPVKAERVDLVPLVRRGLVYAESSGAVWRVAEPARRWEPLRAKLVSKGYKVAQSYIPRSVRSYLEGVRRPELGGGAAAVYAADGVWRWSMGEERGVGCPPARYVAYWGQRPRCGGVLVDLRLLYRRGFWIEAAERLGDGWLLKAWRRDPDDVLDALYALAAEAVRLLEAFASVTGVGVDAILEVFETNSAAALAEAVFHFEAEKRGYVVEDSRRSFDMPYLDAARGRAPGVYRRVAELDFKSLFPSLVAKYGVDPTTARPCASGLRAGLLGRFCFDGGPVADVIGRWLRRRLGAMDRWESEALKWLMNAGIGAWGKAGWGMICEPCLLAVRAEAARLFDEAWRLFSPIYGDTDSIYVEEDRVGDVLRWAETLGGLRLELKGVWDVFLLAPARGGGVAEKNYVKLRAGDLEVKGGLLRPHDLPLAARLRYRDVVRAAVEGGDPLRVAVEALLEAPPEQLFIYKAVWRRRLAEVKKTTPLHVAASYFAKRCSCDPVDVFYLPGDGVVYVPWLALGRWPRPADVEEVRRAAVEYVRRLWKLRALELVS